MILHRYLFRHWLSSFFNASAVLFIFILIADLISGFIKDNIPPQDVVINFFFSIPVYLEKILPIACLLAALFSLIQLRNRNELVAILATTYAPWRILFSFFLYSLVIGLFNFSLSGFIIPLSLELKKEAIPKSYHRFKLIKRKALNTTNIGTGTTWFKGKNYFLSFHAYDKQKKIFHQTGFYQLNQEKIHTEVIKAKTIQYDESQKKWFAIQGEKITKNDQIQFPEITSFEKTFIPLNMLPKDFKDLDHDLNFLDIFSFWNFILKLKKSSINSFEYESMFFDRLIGALCCCFFSLIALFVLVKPERRGSRLGINLLFSFLFIVSYWVLRSYIMNTISDGKISILTGLFIIPSVFIVFILGISKLQKGR